MNRRSLLKFLGLAPVAAVVKADVPIEYGGPLGDLDFVESFDGSQTLGQWLDDLERMQREVRAISGLDLHGRNLAPRRD